MQLVDPIQKDTSPETLMTAVLARMEEKGESFEEAAKQLGLEVSIAQTRSDDVAASQRLLAARIRALKIDPDDFRSATESALMQALGKIEAGETLSEADTRAAWAAAYRRVGCTESAKLAHLGLLEVADTAATGKEPFLWKLRASRAKCSETRT